MPIVSDIADAVVAAINAAPSGTFILGFQAVRDYLPTYELKDMGTLHVTVVPKASDMSVPTRGVRQRDVKIDVAVQQRLQTVDTFSVDPLANLVEQIADYLGGLGRVGNAGFVGAENNPLWIQEHLDSMKQFTGVVTITLRIQTR